MEGGEGNGNEVRKKWREQKRTEWIRMDQVMLDGERRSVVSSRRKCG